MSIQKAKKNNKKSDKNNKTFNQNHKITKAKIGFYTFYFLQKIKWNRIFIRKAKTFYTRDLCGDFLLLNFLGKFGYDSGKTRAF